MKRRLGEHRRDSETGTETKYQVIRQIEAGGDDWEMVLLQEVGPGTAHYEDFWVYTLICEGYTLANMKAGDAKQRARNDAMGSMRARKERYSDAAAFLSAVEREEKEAAARATTARANARAKRDSLNDNFFDWELTLPAGLNPHKHFESPWMKARRAR